MSEQKPHEVTDQETSTHLGPECQGRIDLTLDNGDPYCVPVEAIGPFYPHRQSSGRKKLTGQTMIEVGDAKMVVMESYAQVKQLIREAK